MNIILTPEQQSEFNSKHSNNTIYSNNGANYAAEIGNIELLEKLHELDYNCTCAGIYSAIENGHINIIKKLHTWDIYCTHRSANVAAQYGQIDIIKQLHEWSIDCTTYGATEALEKNNYDIVKILYEFNILPEYDNHPYSIFNIQNLNLIQSLLDDKRFIFHIDTKIIGDLDIKLIKSLRDLGINCSSSCANSIAGKGKLEILKQLHEWGINCTNYGATQAEENGHLNIIQQLHEWGINCTGFEAAKNGHLNIIKQLHDWDIDLTNIATHAARNGHLNIIQQLHEWGIDCPECAAIQAAEKGHLNIIQQLHEWGIDCKHVPNKINLDILKQLHEWGINYKHVPYGINLDILKQLHEWDIDCTNEDAHLFAENGTLDQLKQLHEWGINCTSKGTDSAIRNLIYYHNIFTGSLSNEEILEAKNKQIYIIEQLHEWGIDCSINGIRQLIDYKYFALIKKIFNSQTLYEPNIIYFLIDEFIDIIDYSKINKEKYNKYCGHTNILIKNNQIKTIEKLHELGIDYNNGHANNAADYGHLNILEKLHDWGIDCTSDGVNNAARNGYLNILEKLHNWGIDCTYKDANHAADYGHLNILEKLHEWGVDCTSDGVSYLCNNGNIKTLEKMCDEYDIKPNIDICDISHIVENGYINILKKLISINPHNIIRLINPAYEKTFNRIYLSLKPLQKIYFTNIHTEIMDIMMYSINIDQYYIINFLHKYHLISTIDIIQKLNDIPSEMYELDEWDDNELRKNRYTEQTDNIYISTNEERYKLLYELIKDDITLKKLVNINNTQLVDNFLILMNKTYNDLKIARYSDYIINNYSDNCPICLANTDEIFIKIPTCGHIFHLECLDQSRFYINNNKCPLCRQEYIF